MRMDRLPEALERLEKVVALDRSDRIGAQGLVELARSRSELGLATAEKRISAGFPARSRQIEPTMLLMRLI
jgi:hypothetical protein